MRQQASISVIIVTYKVKSFIAFCLRSLERAKEPHIVEVIMIDNNSKDGLRGFLEEFFPWVRLVENAENIGFGAACNQGEVLATGQFLLFLNPDTIVPKSIFNRFVQAHNTEKNVGILTGLLLDGRGAVLPESARKRPSLLSALFKISSDSNATGYYEVLNDSPIQEIDAACGACIWISRELFVEAGGFDPRFFMYAEDIDLSLQIQMKGRSNYIIKDTPIIHFKGESTSKKSWLYNRHFYSTMASFVKKYIGNGYTYWEWVLVYVATMVLSVISFLVGVFRRSRAYLWDGSIALSLFFCAQFFWSYTRHGIWDYFGEIRNLGIYIIYTSIWIGMMYLGGAYEKGRSVEKILKPLVGGIIASIVFYSLLPLEWRFSRMILLLTGAAMLLITYFRHKKRDRQSNIEGGGVLLVTTEASRELLEIIGRYLAPFKIDKQVSGAEVNEVDESFNHIIFENVETYDPLNIIKEMPIGKCYSFIDSKTKQIVSSEYSSSPGKRYDRISHHHLAQVSYQRQKRFIDIMVSIVIILPLILYQILFVQRISLDFWSDVFTGRKTLVGYNTSKTSLELPILKPFLLDCFESEVGTIGQSDEIIQYSLHYSIFGDLYLVAIGLPLLFRKLTYE